MGNLKNDLEGLESGLILKAMKTIAFMLPMILLSDKLYVKLAGNDAIHHVGFNFNNFMSDINGGAALWSFVFFMVLFMFCYSLEIIWLPTLVAGICDKKMKLKDVKKGIIIAERYLERREGVSNLRYIHIVSRGTIIRWLSYFLITIILWMIYINNVLSYLCIAIMIVLFGFIIRIMNTFYEYYSKDNLQELHTTTQ